MLDKIQHRLLNQPQLADIYKLYKRLRVIQHSPYENIYHCCTQKTASQWFKKVFSDILFYKYTGLEIFLLTKPISERLQDVYINKPFPKNTIGTHLYIDYPTYISIPKPTKYKTFFVLRDPRDLVVSWYFSIKYSHPENHRLHQIRNDLKELPLSEGLKYSIDRLDKVGLFELQKTWVQIPGNSQNIRIFRYEDLAEDNFQFLMQLFDYLEISTPPDKLLELYSKHKFSKYAGDRNQGVENLNSHYRKGMSGDWKIYFDRSVTSHFKKVTRELTEILNYAE